MTDQTTFDCLLTIALPAELEEDLIDLLRAVPQLVSGFTVLPAEGLGAGSPLRSTVEQVRGRARRRLVQVLSSHAQAAELVAHLAQALPSREVAWWTQPVSGFGRLA